MTTIPPNWVDVNTLPTRIYGPVQTAFAHVQNFSIHWFDRFAIHAIEKSNELWTGYDKYVTIAKWNVAPKDPKAVDHISLDIERQVQEAKGYGEYAKKEPELTVRLKALVHLIGLTILGILTLPLSVLATVGLLVSSIYLSLTTAEMVYICRKKKYDDTGDNNSLDSVYTNLGLSETTNAGNGLAWSYIRAPKIAAHLQQQGSTMITLQGLYNHLEVNQHIIPTLELEYDIVYCPRLGVLIGSKRKMDQVGLKEDVLAGRFQFKGKNYVLATSELTEEMPEDDIYHKDRIGTKAGTIHTFLNQSEPVQILFSALFRHPKYRTEAGGNVLLDPSHSAMNSFEDLKYIKAMADAESMAGRAANWVLRKEAEPGQLVRTHSFAFLFPGTVRDQELPIGAECMMHLFMYNKDGAKQTLSRNSPGYKATPTRETDLTALHWTWIYR